MTGTDLNELIERYLAGESAESLAPVFNMNATTIRKRLRAAGVTLRTQGEANKLRFDYMTKHDIIRMVSPAHEAVRGRKKPRRLVDEVLRKRATNAKHQASIRGKGELELVEMLRRRHLRPEVQFPEGWYNIDLAINPVAVEVHTCASHPFTNPRLRKRTKQLLGRWSVLYVWITNRHPLTEVGADEIHTWVKKVRCDPSLVSQYRVIRGDGEFVTGGGRKSKELAVVPTLKPYKRTTGWKNSR